MRTLIKQCVSRETHSSKSRMRCSNRLANGILALARRVGRNIPSPPPLSKLQRDESRRRARTSPAKKNACISRLSEVVNELNLHSSRLLFAQLIYSFNILREMQDTRDYKLLLIIAMIVSAMHISTVRCQAAMDQSFIFISHCSSIKITSASSLLGFPEIGTL